MNDVINEYQKWKQQGESLRTQAKHAMESRFRELLTEAVEIAEEYRADFGAALKTPPQVTAFRYKSSAKPKAKKTAAARSAPAAAPKAAPAPAPAVKPDPKVAAIEKKLAGAKKKLEEVKAAGGAIRPIEDRIYELEDALRLAMQA
ncbi:MAG: hypothetical protein JST11_28495 [Acidobacteria bacterium]|nr:hypothetical protein [Acidobacteriota bacterium]